MSEIEIDIEALFDGATQMIDLVRDSQFGTYIDVFLILLAVALAVLFFWQISSSQGA